MTGSGPAPVSCMCRGDELGGIFARIHRALKPSGVFYASFKIGEGDGRDSLGRYYNYPSPDWLHAAYAAAGRVGSADVGHQRDPEF